MAKLEERNMFRCQSCETQSTVYEKPMKLVTKTRTQTYTNRIRVGRDEKIKQSKGLEIVEEKSVCGKCHSAHKKVLDK